mmetsp:Transcript_26424/g.87630  ORF Transcript_26424/g.87630 Transcript_26424/m.87630 type:complete len:283 (+) Transcript_26424:164-1012(+)
MPGDPAENTPLFERGVLAALLRECTPLVLRAQGLHCRFGLPEHEHALVPLGKPVLAQQLQQQREALAREMPTEPEAGCALGGLRRPIIHSLRFPGNIGVCSIVASDCQIHGHDELLAHHGQCFVRHVRPTSRGDSSSRISQAAANHHREALREQRTEEAMQLDESWMHRLSEDPEAWPPKSWLPQRTSKSDTQDEPCCRARGAHRHHDAVGVRQLAALDLLRELQGSAGLAQDSRAIVAAGRECPRCHLAPLEELEEDTQNPREAGTPFRLSSRQRQGGQVV